MTGVPLRVAMTLEQCWHRVPGGTAVAALSMARELARAQGLELTGVAAAHRRPPPPQWRPPIRVRHLLLPRLALYESWHRLRWPPIERATGPVDVIHATGIAMPPRTAPIVVTIHDLAFLRYPAHFTQTGLRFFHQGLGLALEAADLVLCSSTATLEDCRAAGFRSDRLRHVPLGVDVRLATGADVERVRSRYRLSSPYVLWTGTIEPRKNLSGLLQAFARVDRSVDLVLVGPKGWNEDLHRQLAGLDPTVRSKIKVLGFVPGYDLAALYAGAQVFCFPSLLEGFGFPVVEAMAQGTPVVTSRATSTAELGEGAAILVDPGDPASIAHGIVRIVDDPGLANELARAGRERAREYSWDRTASLVRQAYEEAAS